MKPGVKIARLFVPLGLLAVSAFAAAADKPATQPADPEAARLFMVSQSVLFYANEHAGRVPPSLGKLAAYCRVEKIPVKWFAGKAPEGFELLDGEPRDNQIESRTDIQLLATGNLLEMHNPADVPILFLKSATPGSVVIGFSDGHVEKFAAVRSDQTPSATQPSRP
jgi:hypothetical protein